MKLLAFDGHFRFFAQWIINSHIVDIFQDTFYMVLCHKDTLYLDFNFSTMNLDNNSPEEN